MFDVNLGHHATCDGASRRRFLRVGALGLAGLSLADLIRRRARGESIRDRSVIQVVLGGGLSHVDTYDPKPDAPAEFRGEFGAIPTSVPGIALSERLPEQARIMDRLVVIRGLHHATADHAEGSHWVLTGHAPRQATPRANERPSVGSVVARVLGANRPGIPAYVAVPTVPPFGYAAYLGAGSNPFQPGGSFDVSGEARVPHLDPPPGLTLERLEDRRQLLTWLDRADRRRDLSGTMDGLDRFTAEAYAMITGPDARRAFDLGREDPRVRDRYGRTTVGQACLLARRLVEAGVAFVTVNEGGWDHHGQIFPSLRRQLPALDTALAALVTDLHDRGLSDRVLVLVWGEFGRTPLINGRAGRDHWPSAFSALLAGGGLQTGRVIGSTGHKGEAPIDRPVRPEDVIQTVYRVLGIDPTRTFANEAGRPMSILNEGAPLDELL